ncbi:MAG TPA: hypothetical protein VN660_01405 [Steroidobacteraceae bacterium]|nr:hypothetical protein [Steroidobacteraceae bacterium]
MLKVAQSWIVFFSALAIAQQAQSQQSKAPKTVSFAEFFSSYQSLQQTHTEVQISGVYTDFAGADWLYADLETADSHSLTPIGQRPVPIWLGERNLSFAERHHVTLIGHVEWCVEWQTNLPSEGLVIHSVPTKLNPGNVPVGSQTIGCLVVDQAYVH